MKQCPARGHFLPEEASKALAGHVQPFNFILCGPGAHSWAVGSLPHRAQWPGQL